jgi:serine protease inhibitor
MMHVVNFKVFLPLLAGAFMLTSCQKEESVPEANTPNLRPLSSAERQTVSSANDFAYRAFGKVRQAAPGDNLCLSPLSISAVLTMACNGADGSTKAAMKQTLGVTAQTDQEINESYKSLFALLTGMDKKVAFSVANSLWYNQQYQLKAPFVQTNQTYFGATVQGVDFSSSLAKSSINNWVADKTQGHIPSIIDQTTADDVLYLLNAIYFKGTWTYRFDQSQTKQEAFHLENGSSKNVNFMVLKQGRYLRYGDAQQAVIDLPYGNRQFSMTFVVPQGTATLADVAGRLSSPQLATWLAKADTASQELHMPKFKFDYTKTLNQTLSQLGMAEAFSNQANFSQMLASGPKALTISEVKHKTFLEVTEEGTTAAAATSVGIVTTSVTPQPPLPLRIDRPFMFLIRERSSNTVLFVGQLTNP